MKKNIFLLFPFLFFCCLNIQAQTAESRKITSKNIQTSLNYLASNALKGRSTGTPGIEKAARYIEQLFKKHGIRPYFETYRDSFSTQNGIGYNIVGFIKGTDPKLKKEIVLLGAHYDHIGVIDPIAGDSIANGANDNAAGTVAVLQIAQYFASQKPKRSLMIALFAGEELGLLGSKHLADKLKKQQADLYTMLNFEMVGVPLKNKPYLAYLTGFNMSNFAHKFNEYAGKEIFGFLPQAKQYKLFFRSDNYPFYKTYGIPAQTLCTFDFTNYDYYHHVKDEAHLMDAKHMENLVVSLIPGIEKMLNTPKKEIKMNPEENGK